LVEMRFLQPIFIREYHSIDISLRKRDRIVFREKREHIDTVIYKSEIATQAEIRNLDGENRDLVIKD